jgi:hypothetical protein
MIVAVIFLLLLMTAPDVELENELARYEREALELRMRPLDVGHVLRRGGQRLTLGGFAQGAEKIFGSVPEAMSDVRKYRAFKASGIASLVLGFGLITVDTVLATLSIINKRPLDIPLFVSLLVIGLDLSGVGLGFLIFAPNYLQRAVSVYNERIVSRP